MAGGKRASAISSFGLTGAPATAAPVAPIPSQNPEPASPRRRDPMSPRVRFEAPPAGSRETVQGTLRLHQDDAAELDVFRAKLRAGTHRRALDQSEIIRTLLKLAIDDDSVQMALVRALMVSRAHDITTTEEAGQ